MSRLSFRIRHPPHAPRHQGRAHVGEVQGQGGVEGVGALRLRLACDEELGVQEAEEVGVLGGPVGRLQEEVREEGKKLGEEGEGADAGAAASAQGMSIYVLTKTGVELQATVGGTKYWKDEDLN